MVWLLQLLADLQKYLHSRVVALLVSIHLFLKNKQNPQLPVCLLSLIDNLAMKKNAVGLYIDVLKFQLAPPSKDVLHCN